MILKYEQLVEHNKAFSDAFVNLKVTGWKAYSTAFNNYTFKFFSTQMKTLDDSVEKLGKIMKGEFDEQ